MLIKTIYFKEFALYPVALEELKEWCIIQLSQGRGESSVCSSLKPFRKLINLGFLPQEGFLKIDKIRLAEYYSQLNLNQLNNSTGLNEWHTLKRFYQDLGAKEISSYLNRFYLPKRNRKLRHDNKLIPHFVLEQLDRIFYHEDMPVSFKFCYWLLRLIPNRIQDGISVPFDCLKKDNNNTFILKLPTFKQDGAYAKAQWRYIYLKNEGLGAYLIDLILKQQNYLKINDGSTDFLLADKTWDYKNSEFKERKATKIRPFGPRRFNKTLKRIIKIFNVTDENGNSAYVTSHMFRHNAVTERTDSGLFSFHDIALMSGHHTTTMLEIAYNHTDFNKTKETVLSFEEAVPDFKGKVLPDATEQDFKKLASRPYAREIEGLGVCRDVRGCKAQYYKCYECEYFKIENKNPDKLKEERTGWESKKLLAQRAGDKKFEDECDNNINGINILLERIKNER